MVPHLDLLTQAVRLLGLLHGLLSVIEGRLLVIQSLVLGVHNRLLRGSHVRDALRVASPKTYVGSFTKSLNSLH